MRQLFSHFLRGAVAAIAALSLSVGPASADVWKMQTLWTAGSPNQTIVETFADRVKEATNGEVEISVFPVGAVVLFTETLEAVGRGVFQAQHSSSLDITAQFQLPTLLSSMMPVRTG